MTRKHAKSRAQKTPGSLDSVIVSSQQRKPLLKYGLDLFLLVLRRLRSSVPFGSSVRRTNEGKNAVERENSDNTNNSSGPLVDSSLLVLAGPSLGAILVGSVSPVVPSYSEVVDKMQLQTAHPLELLDQLSPLSSVGVVSPKPGISFSPADYQATLLHQKTDRVIQELVESEHNFVASMKAVSRYFADACLVRCSNLSVTCAPLFAFSKLLHEMVANHEVLLRHMRSDRLEVALGALDRTLATTNYAEYAGTAEMLALLSHGETPPFELAWIRSLNQFLERFQPFGRRMDLSIHLLMQKPMARIAKYPLFLSALLLLNPGTHYLARSLLAVTSRLSQIDTQIETETVKLDTLKLLERSLNYLALVGRPAQFFGPVTFCGEFAAFSVVATGSGEFAVNHQLVDIICHKFHMVIAGKTTNGQKMRHIFPIAACAFVRDVYKCVSGLTSSADFAVKVRLEVTPCQYEIMLASIDEDAYTGFLEAVNFKGVRVTTHPRFPAPGDCFVDPRLAIYDVSVDPRTLVDSATKKCYFRQVFDVNIGEALQELFRERK